MIGYRVPPPLTNDQAHQHLIDNPSMVGTVMSVQGADGAGRGPYAEVSYTVAYWAGNALKAVSGIQSRPRLPEIVDVQAAEPGDPVIVVKRGARVDFIVTAFPHIEVCETQP